MYGIYWDYTWHSVLNWVFSLWPIFFFLKITLMNKCMHWKLSIPLIPPTVTHTQIMTFIYIGDCIVRCRKVAWTNRVWNKDIKGFFQLFHRMMTPAAHSARHSAPMYSFKGRIYPQARNDQWQQGQTKPSASASFFCTTTDLIFCSLFEYCT